MTQLYARPAVLLRGRLAAALAFSLYALPAVAQDEPAGEYDPEKIAEEAVVTEPPAERPGIAVMPLTPRRFPKESAHIMDEMLAGELNRYGTHQIITTEDIKAMLGHEALKQATGCDDVSCAAEIGGALGAQFLLVGSVSKLGESVFISVRMIDTRNSVVERRAERTIADDESLFAKAIREVVAGLFSDSPPPAVTNGAPTFNDFESRFKREGWKRYLDYRDASADPLMPLDWASDLNQESQALFFTEIFLTPVLLAITAAIFVPLGGDQEARTGDDTISTIGAFVAVGTLVPTAILLIIDSMNLGGVEVF